MGTMETMETILEHLSEQLGKPVTQEEMWDMDEINLGFANINTLDPLSRCSKLKELYCYDTDISSLEPLRYCEELVTLVCKNTKISSVEPLIKLTNLRFLWINSAPVDCIEQLPSGIERLIRT